MHGPLGSVHLRTLNVRPARAADIAEFYDGSWPETLRAYVATLDDEVVGVIGIATHRGVNRVFSDMKDELRPYLRSMKILRLIKRVIGWIPEYRGLVYAIPDDDEGRRVLTRLGFEDRGEHFEWAD